MLKKWRIDQSKDLQDQANYCALNINVLESMEDWVRVIDKEGNILFMNKSMEEFTNTRTLEYKCSFEEDIISEKAVIPRSVSLTTLLTNVSHTSEILFLGKEYSVSSSPIQDEDGQVYAAVEVFRNISEEVNMRRELFNTNKTLVDDVEFAKTIQKQLLPKKKDYNNINIDYYYRPSEELSGDMFGINKIDDKRVGIYMCDVVGHGVSASLLTMFIKQNISALITEGYGIYPNLLLNKLKEKFGELGLSSSVYATIFYGYYSEANDSFIYANAGHNCHPILLKPDGDLDTMEASGFPISDLFIGFDYKEQSIDVERGDQLIFYTDGVTEARNYRNDEFGQKRLKDTVNNIFASEEDLIENIVEAIKNFIWGEPDDDMAILLARVD